MLILYDVKKALFFLLLITFTLPLFLLIWDYIFRKVFAYLCKIKLFFFLA